MTSAANKSTTGKQLAGFFFALVMLAAVGGFAWAAYKLLTGVAAETGAAIVAGAGTIVVVVVSSLLAKYAEHQSQIEEAHRKSKIPLYEEFLGFCLKFMMHSKPGAPAVTDVELQQLFLGFTQKVIVWGSDDVFREYVAFWRAAVRSAGNPDAVRALTVQFGKLMLAIRKDVGHTNKDITSVDVLSTFSNDAEDFMSELPSGGSGPKLPGGVM